MEGVIRTIANTVLRATVYKGMRGQSMMVAVILAGVAALGLIALNA